jgi:hypothetical protein
MFLVTASVENNRQFSRDFSIALLSKANLSKKLRK